MALLNHVSGLRLHWQNLHTVAAAVLDGGGRAIIVDVWNLLQTGARYYRRRPIGHDILVHRMVVHRRVAYDVPIQVGQIRLLLQHF